MDNSGILLSPYKKYSSLSNQLFQANKSMKQFSPDVGEATNFLLKLKVFILGSTSYYFSSAGPCCLSILSAAILSGVTLLIATIALFFRPDTTLSSPAINAL